MKIRWLVLMLAALLMSAELRGEEWNLAAAERALREEKSDANRLLSASFFFESAGRPFVAIRTAERAVELNPTAPIFHARLGALLLGRARFKEAIAAYTRAADLDPDGTAYRAALALACNDAGFKAESAATWRQLVEKSQDPGIVNWAAEQAELRYSEIDDFAGIEALWRAAYQRIDNPEEKQKAAEHLVEAIHARGAHGEALQFWRELFEKATDPDSMETFAVCIGKAEAKMPAGEGRFQATIQAWRKVLERGEDRSRKQTAALALASALLNAEQPQEALGVLATPPTNGTWNEPLKVARLQVRAHAETGDVKSCQAVFSRLSELPTANFNERLDIYKEWALLFTDARERETHWRVFAAEFPWRHEPLVEWAGALTDAGQSRDALATFEKAMDMLPAPRSGLEQRAAYASSMMNLCGKLQDAQRAVGIMRQRFSQVDDPSVVEHWLKSLQNGGGERVAMDAAMELSKGDGVLRLGAAQYFNEEGHSELARPLFDVAGSEAAIPRERRLKALWDLLELARSNPERTTVARRIVATAESMDERAKAIVKLAACLGREGRIQEGANVIAQAAALGAEGDAAEAGHEALESFTDGFEAARLFDESVRAGEALDTADQAVRNLFAKLGDDSDYSDGLAELASAIAATYRQWNDAPRARRLLAELIQTRDLPGLRLALAEHLNRTKDPAGAWAEYVSYSEALARQRAIDIQEGEPGTDENHVEFNDAFISFTAREKKQEAFASHFMKRIESAKGMERECLAAVALAAFKQFRQPAKALPLIKQIRSWDAHPSIPDHDLEWAEAALRLDNANSQADTQIRDSLLAQTEQWKKALSENPDDYQAAINAFKTLQLLGRRADAAPFLAQAERIGADDPVALEALGREYMLEKDYVRAMTTFSRAVKASGSAARFESAIVKTCELAGDAKEALAMIVAGFTDARAGCGSERDFDSAFDLAERSNLQSFLQAETVRHVEAARTARRVLRYDLARLALRVASENKDEGLATTVIDALRNRVIHGGGLGHPRWMIHTLATEAVERKQLAHAARLFRINVDACLARGETLESSHIRETADTHIRAGLGGEIADLLFGNLAAANQEWTVPNALDRVRRPWDGKGILFIRASVENATRDLLNLVAQESAAGGSAFRAACGPRLAALIELEFIRLKGNPSDYDRPLTHARLEMALGLRDRVTAVYRDAATTTPGRFAYAARLATLLSRQPAVARDPAVNAATLKAACEAAIGGAIAEERPWILERCGVLWHELLGTSDFTPPPETAETAFAYLSRAIESSDGRPSSDALVRAIALAERLKRFDLAATHAAIRHRLFPENVGIRNQRASILLKAGEIDEAQRMLQEAVAQSKSWNEWRDAGALMMRPVAPAESPTPAAAAAAAAFHRRAAELYVAQSGRPVADLSTDSEWLALQERLAVSLAQAGQLDAALPVYLAIAPSVQATSNKAVDIIAAAFAQRSKELVEALTARIVADPRNANLRLALAAAEEHAQNYQAAAKALYAAKTLDPQTATVKWLVGVLRKARMFDAATDECSEWAASLPRDPEVYRAMAEVCRDAKDERGELRALTMLVEVAPRDAENCRSVGILLAERQDFRRALALLERAVELRGEEPGRRVDLAEVCVWAGDAARAEALLKEALSGDWEKGLGPVLRQRVPTFRGTFENRAHALLAEVYASTGRNDAADQERAQLPPGFQRKPMRTAK